MSLENNENRIDILEEMVLKMNSVQEKLTYLMRLQELQNARTMQVALLIKNDQDSLIRWLISTPLIPDEKTRQSFLDQIKKTESQFSEVSARQAELLQKLERDFPLLPPI